MTTTQSANQLINIMENQQIKQKIESIWLSLKGLKAADIEQQIAFSQKTVQSIIGRNQIDKVKHTSLLKLLVFELIIFANQKCSSDDQCKTVRKVASRSSSKEKQLKPTIRIKQIKEILANAIKQKIPQSSNIIMEINEFKTLVRKIAQLEEELAKEETARNRNQSSQSNDSQGMQLMVEQMECLLKKKENRIRELNCQLEENFNDKQELEEEIEELEIRNLELEARIKQVEEECEKVNREFENYRNQQKDELLFGASEFMNTKLPIKRVENHYEESTFNELNEETLEIPHEFMPASTKILAKYCTPPPFKHHTEQRTVKKKPSTKIIEKTQQSQQQNLLQSVRIEKKQYSQQTLPSEDEYFQRILLMQALCIEHVLVL